MLGYPQGSAIRIRAAHKVRGVKELIEAAGAELRYLPRHSPGFNPIEHCRPVVKRHLRRLKARSLEALDHVILALISPEIAANRFRHCGAHMLFGGGGKCGD